MSIWWESVILRASVARSWPKSPPFASCYRCAELIDGRRWAELTDRAFTIWRQVAAIGLLGATLFGFGMWRFRRQFE